MRHKDEILRLYTDKFKDPSTGNAVADALQLMVSAIPFLLETLLDIRDCIDSLKK